MYRELFVPNMTIQNTSKIGLEEHLYNAREMDENINNVNSVLNASNKIFSILPVSDRAGHILGYQTFFKDSYNTNPHLFKVYIYVFMDPRRGDERYEDVYIYTNLSQNLGSFIENRDIFEASKSLCDNWTSIDKDYNNSSPNLPKNDGKVAANDQSVNIMDSKILEAKDMDYELKILYFEDFDYFVTDEETFILSNLNELFNSKTIYRPLNYIRNNKRKLKGKNIDFILRTFNSDITEFVPIISALMESKTKQILSGNDQLEFIFLKQGFKYFIELIPNPKSEHFGFNDTIKWVRIEPNKFYMPGLQASEFLIFASMEPIRPSHYENEEISPFSHHL
ncbi:hypothetical protein AYI68_g4136 [Smittium mucronatum]|uniref:Uncharacterized protein n=1 Tax=Smittium mucronatum TaxID=133383 RepID=A0A1R0GXY2_9FUNG|nr:hypothetical protein AYI68_g4136 [Smittium mucronatum]